MTLIRNSQELEKTLNQLNGKSYKAYNDIKGEYRFENYTLYLDLIQGDPFARPSRIRIRMNQKIAQFPLETFKNHSRCVALRDFLARCFFISARSYSKGNRGTGHSGMIRIERPGQEILERSSVMINQDFVEVRFVIGLPAFGRRIAAKHASEMLFTEIPRIVEHSLFFQNLNKQNLYHFIETAEDADYIREQLKNLGIVAFIADEAILPRSSGIDPRPLTKGNIIPFYSPDCYRLEILVPNRGTIKGMGIPTGITLIVGGGFHGKSTLLNGIESGIYNHIPGDGREFVITNPNAMKIRAMDGRNIEKVNISPFINNLPFGTNTHSFSTENASGSTSQAANIIEAIEMGTELLLIDEDTSATNFMIRDQRMQNLISKDDEPITPFIDKVKQLFEEMAISTILVMGGSGDYFSVADHVITMRDYLPVDMTLEAKEIVSCQKNQRKNEGGDSFGKITHRIPLKNSFDPSRGKKAVKISVKDLHQIVFGTYEINLLDLEHLVDIGQTRAIGDAIFYSTQFMNNHLSLNEIAQKVIFYMNNDGLDILDRIPSGEYVVFRKFEFMGAINRLRSIKMKLLKNSNCLPVVLTQPPG